MTEPTKHIFDDRIEWRLNGKVHREDGPAIEWTDGGKFWYNYGERHREGGPAVEWADAKVWYLFGQGFTEEKFKQITYSD